MEPASSHILRVYFCFNKWLCACKRKKRKGRKILENLTFHAHFLKKLREGGHDKSKRERVYTKKEEGMDYRKLYPSKERGDASAQGAGAPAVFQM